MPGSGPVPFPGYLNFWTLCPEVGAKNRDKTENSCSPFCPCFLASHMRLFVAYHFFHNRRNMLQ